MKPEPRMARALLISATAFLLAIGLSAAINTSGGGYDVPLHSDGVAAGTGTGGGYVASGYSTVVSGYAGASGGGYQATVGMYGVAQSGDDDSGNGDTSSGSGSSGGGGGGGDRAWASGSTVTTHETIIDAIAAGTERTVSFRDETIAVHSIILAPNTACEHVVVTVSLMTEPTVSAGTAYQYLDISVKNCPGPARVRFAVPSSWLAQQGAQEARLRHYINGKWQELPTSSLGTKGGETLFEAQTPSFSPFAITTRVIEAEVAPTPIAPGDDEERGEEPGKKDPDGTIEVVSDRRVLKPWVAILGGTAILGLLIAGYHWWESGTKRRKQKL